MDHDIQLAMASKLEAKKFIRKKLRYWLHCKTLPVTAVQFEPHAFVVMADDANLLADTIEDIQEDIKNYRGQSRNPDDVAKIAQLQDIIQEAIPIVQFARGGMDGPEAWLLRLNEE